MCVNIQEKKRKEILPISVLLHINLQSLNTSQGPGNKKKKKIQIVFVLWHILLHGLANMQISTLTKVTLTLEKNI